MSRRDDIECVIENKAENDSGWAIAYALMRIGKAIEDLGFNNYGGDPGTTEKIAMGIADQASALDRLAESVETMVVNAQESARG